MSEQTNVEETWVNVREGAEITGYHTDHVKRLAMKNWRLPEDQREIRLRKRSNGYDMWLPDLVAYVSKPGHGPQRKRKQTESAA